MDTSNEERAEQLFMLHASVIFMEGLPWYTDFQSDDERTEYLKNRYSGATLKELLFYGIDPFK